MNSPNPNPNPQIISKTSYKKYWMILLFIIAVISTVVIVYYFVNKSNITDIITNVTNNLGMFIFTLVDNDNNGLIIPVVVSDNNETNATKATNWFKPGVIRGITPIYDQITKTISVSFEPNLISQIQSISFASSGPDNASNYFLVPSMGSPTSNVIQHNYIIMGDLKKSLIELYNLTSGVKEDLSVFTKVDSGPTTYTEMKQMVEDNLRFNNYCVGTNDAVDCIPPSW